MRITVILYFILFFTIKANACQKDTLLNQQAKKILFQQSLDKKVAPDFYHDKLVILDFWATWCAPCIAGFPHLNELSKKYSNSEVIFASITKEPLPIVEKFFSRTKKELLALKLVDTIGITFKAYNVLTRSLSGIGIPYCVIIDKNNIIRWTGNTNDLTGEIITSIIHTEQISTSRAPVKTDKPANKPLADRALFAFNTAKSDTVNFTSEVNCTYVGYESSIIKLSGINKPLNEIIELVTNRSKIRFITNNDLKIKELIDINFNLGSEDSLRFRNYKNTFLNNEPIKNFTISLLSEAFKFNAKVIRKKQKHYELVIADIVKLHSFIAMSNHSSFDGDHYPLVEIVRFNLNDIATNLESIAKIIITTHVKDDNKFDLSLDITNAETLNKSLLFHGLKLIEVNDEIELFNISFY